MRVVPASIRHCGPWVPGLRSAISCQRVPSPSSVCGDRPQGLSRGDGVRPGAAAVAVRDGVLWVALAPWWLAAGGAQAGAAGVVLAGAVAATSWVAAADGVGRAGPAANSRTAAPTRPRAADWGSASAGRCGVGIRRSRDEHFEGDGGGQERPAGPGDHGQDAQRQGAVVAGGQGVQICSRVGTWSGIGLAPIARSMAGQAGQHREDGQGCGQPDQAGADGCGSLLDASDGSGDAGLAVAGDGHRGDPDDPQERGVVGVAHVHGDRGAAGDGDRSGQPGRGQVGAWRLGGRGGCRRAVLGRARRRAACSCWPPVRAAWSATARACCWAWTCPPRSTASPTRTIIAKPVVTSQMLIDPRSPGRARWCRVIGVPGRCRPGRWRSR